MFKKFIKKVAKSISLKYDIYKIFKINKNNTDNYVMMNNVQFIELNQTSEDKFDSTLLTKYNSYLGNGSHCFVCLKEDDIVGICFYWVGTRYLERNFIPLLSTEAKLIQIEVLESARGHGIAPKLIDFSSQEMFKKNYKSLYARIWHSNKASIRSFRKSGWLYQKTVIALSIGGINLKFHIPRIFNNA
ncbi:MAG: ribosomal protein S18 acetylase RimI-like enzyme [Psychroserpens sp.]|jgi:ribosomal protein S18 acetylase RimI-like enzyme|uniref:GNAT family N-acetyltransferase n=1 Tax=Colwellia sp. KU-HH00111 TaxID=3127652 RepID=UPI003105D49C